MRKVYTLQLSDFYPSATLPQAMGSLLGYVFQNESIKKNFEVCRTFWENETFDQIIKEIEGPDVLLCSCYVWNWDRTYQVIKFIRKHYPSCLIIIGGPEPEYTSNWLCAHPEVDLLIPYYGESVLESVLVESLMECEYSKLPGVITKKSMPQQFPKPNFDKMVSPFLNGFFENLLNNKRSETTSIRAVFESNRGCPFSCTFCDVGASIYTKVNRFELQKCFDELEWMVQNGVDAIDVADANFGILSRDEDIVNKMIELKKKYNWQGRFLPTWSKVKGDRVLRIAKNIIHNKLDSVFGLSLQSLSPEVLFKIKRKNAFNLSDLSAIISDLSENNVPVYTEVIFPLPGETIDSFLSGIHSVLDMKNVFDKFQVNQLSKYNNAEIASVDQTKKFGIEWKKINGFTRHYYGDNSKDIIAVKTEDINKEDVFEGLFYVKCFIIPLYFYGTVRSIADHLLKFHGLLRSQFFKTLYKNLESEPWFIKFKNAQRDHYFSAIEGKVQFGQILTKDPLDFFPEFSIAHQFYLKSPLFDKLEEIYPEHRQAIIFSKNSLWTNKADEVFQNIKFGQKEETWRFVDNRVMDKDSYFRELYISGRFDQRWRKKLIERVKS